MRADWTASGACTSGSTAPPRGATRPRRASGGVATTSTPTKARARAEARLQGDESLILGLGGGWIQRFIGREWGLVLGPVSIAIGLAWPGWIRLPIPRIPLRARRTASTWGAVALGASFSVAICPACTPALVVLLGVAA